jgi:ATP-binding cassette subfamily B multidrug efflux pump
MFQLRFVWKNLKGRRWMVIAGIIISAITSMVVIVNPYLSKILVDDVIRGGAHELLIPILAIMLGVVVVKSAFRYLMICFLEWSSQGMLVTLRERIFDNLQHQDMRFYDRMRTGDLITRVTGDLDAVRHLIAWITYMSTDSIVTLLSAIVFLFTVNYKLTLALLAVVPFFGIVSFLYSRKVRTLYREIRNRFSDLNTTAQENIAGNRVVKAFAREEYEKEKFFKQSDDYRQINLTASLNWNKVVPIINFLSELLPFITLLFGGYLVMNNEMTLGQLTQFTGLTWALTAPLQNVSGLLNDVQRFIASIDKVIEVYYAQPLIVDRYDAVESPERMQGKIEFKNVSFSYGKEKVLDNVSFTVEPKQTVAIMGPTGCGKTTLISLISRFYDPQQGEILMDDVNIKLRTLSSIRSAVGVATQDVFLFSDTIDGNISFANPEMSDEQMKNCAKIACADGFIRRTVDGYDTIVGERGVGLSGGQKQRIALARALASKPAILILDDTTSAVDMETEAIIQQNLKNLPYDCTKIIIAQRISSVRWADKIMIMQNGKLDIGTHDSLARTNRYYREVCDLQDVANLPEFEGGDE